MVKALERWNKRHKTRNELMAMTDRELNDIGINRCDIGNILSEL